jgi:hypothetical protein
MYCPRCGTNNDAAAAYCTSCGNSLRQTQQIRPNVPNYLAQAILVTILCCLPFGIVAIVYAAQVNGRLETGNYSGAEEASRKAKTWCWVSFGVGLSIIILYLFVVILGGALSAL